MKNEIDKDAYDLGMRVKELRLSFGWTQKELAAIVGASPAMNAIIDTLLSIV